jgi:cell division protein FtsL
MDMSNLPKRQSRFSRGEKAFGVSFILAAIFSVLFALGGVVLTVWLVITVINYLQAHS